MTFSEPFDNRGKEELPFKRKKAQAQPGSVRVLHLPEPVGVREEDRTKI